MRRTQEPYAADGPHDRPRHRQTLAGPLPRPGRPPAKGELLHEGRGGQPRRRGRRRNPAWLLRRPGRDEADARRLRAEVARCELCRSDDSPPLRGDGPQPHRGAPRQTRAAIPQSTLDHPGLDPHAPGQRPGSVDDRGHLRHPLQHPRRGRGGRAAAEEPVQGEVGQAADRDQEEDHPLVAGARPCGRRCTSEALPGRRQTRLRLRPATGRGIRLRRRGHRLQGRLDPRQPPGKARRYEARVRPAQGQQDPVSTPAGSDRRCPQGPHEGVPTGRGHPAVGQAGRRAEVLPPPLRRQEGAGLQPQRLQHGRLEARSCCCWRHTSPRARSEVPPGGSRRRDACPPARLRLRTPGRGESIKALSDYLGHSDPDFTLRPYTHLLPSSETRTRKAIDDAFMEPETQETGEAEGTSVPAEKSMCPKCALAARRPLPGTEKGEARRPRPLPAKPQLTATPGSKPDAPRRAAGGRSPAIRAAVGTR